MATITQGIPQGRIQFTGRNGLVDKYYYFVMTLATAATVFWGFSHTIGARVLHPPIPVPSILLVHITAFSCWMCFLVLQSTLVRVHNVRLHRTLGWFGVGLGVFMVPLGIATAIIMGRYLKHQLHVPGMESILVFSFGDLIVFSILLALAIRWRKKRDLHRVMMIATACLFLNAAFARVPFFAQLHFSYFFTSIALNLIFLTGALRDWLVNRRIQRAYFILPPILIAFQIFISYISYGTPSWWTRFADSLLG